MSVVSVEGLVVRYGDVTAVDGLSFHANAGAVTALLGPNGAGKTTTVETIEGYRKPHGGLVRVHDLDPVADAKALLPRIGVMLQRGGIYPSMGIAAALDLFANYYASPASPAELLERVGLEGRVHQDTVAPVVGRRATTGVARAGADRQPGRGVPRRADRGSRSTRTPTRARRRRGPARRWRVRRADHPRTRRGRAPRRPHRDRRQGPASSAKAPSRRTHRVGRFDDVCELARHRRGQPERCDGRLGERDLARVATRSRWAPPRRRWPLSPRGSPNATCRSPNSAAARDSKTCSSA